MKEIVTTNYFWGQDVEMSQFYRVPKALYTGEYFRGISFEAKAIYGMMIDRVSLSIKNGWLDEDGKTYIHYSVADIMADTGCGKNTILKCLKELEGMEYFQNPNGSLFKLTEEEFDQIIGLERLKAIHVNDSKNPFGSHKDRHECLGEGYLGLETFRRIVNHPLLKDKPMILETPNELPGYQREIALLRQMEA